MTGGKWFEEGDGIGGGACNNATSGVISACVLGEIFDEESFVGKDFVGDLVVGDVKTEKRPIWRLAEDERGWLLRFFRLLRLFLEEGDGD